MLKYFVSLTLLSNRVLSAFTPVRAFSQVSPGDGGMLEIATPTLAAQRPPHAQNPAASAVYLTDRPFFPVFEVVFAIKGDVAYFVSRPLLPLNP